MADDSKPSSDVVISFTNALDELLGKYRDTGLLSFVEAIGVLELFRASIVREALDDNDDDDDDDEDDSFVVEEEGE